MKSLLSILLVFFFLNQYCQCTFTIIPTFTAASCPTCCDGAISASVTGSGSPCAPTTWQLDPGGFYSPIGTWTNLCAGNYTVNYVTGCCILPLICFLPYTSTGIESTAINSQIIKAFPNPVSEVLHISYNGSFNREPQIEIVNSFGQVVFKDKYKEEIDISTLPGGIYYLKIDSADHQFQTRFIKQ